MRVYKPGLLNHFRGENFSLPDIGFGLMLWYGKFEDTTAEWVCWTDDNENLLLTERAAHLAEKLCELGIRGELNLTKS